MFIRYRTGEDFLRDNAPLLKSHPLETAFFPGNARNLPDMRNGFAGKVSQGEAFLLCIRYDRFPMVLYGSPALCPELAQALHTGADRFTTVLGREEVLLPFLAAYEALAGGNHSLVHAMDIMRCDRLRDCPTPQVEPAVQADVEALTDLTLAFNADTHQAPRARAQVREDVLDQLGSYAVLRRDGHIAAMAKRTRQEDRLCSISGVYTDPAFRGQGLARQVVTHLTRAILAEGRLPYLFVDKANPISNHLYLSIGYTYDAPTMEMAYLPPQ